MRLLLIRHGQTPSNVDGLLDTGAPGPGLTDLGHRQAEAVPQVLAGRSIDAVAVSSRVRTELTARPLLHERRLRVATLDGLREIDAGDLEMSGDHDAHLRYLETAFGWARGHLDRPMPGAEDGEAFLARFDDALGAVASWDASTVAVFSHGAAIRAWSSIRVRGIDVDEMEHHPLVNTGMVEVQGDPESGWELVDWVRHPLGGAHLLPGATADDPTGEPVDEVEAESEA